MTFDEYLIKLGYKEGEPIPGAQARQLWDNWNKLSYELLKEQELGEKEAAFSNVENAAAGITDLLNLYEASNVPLPQNMMERAVTSIESGNLKSLNRLYDEMNKFDDTYLNLNKGMVRQALPEELPPGAIGGQVVIRTGEIKPFYAPSGTSFRTTDEGGFELLQGPGVTGQTAKEKRVEEAKEKIGIERSRASLTSLSQAIPLIETELSSSLVGGLVDIAKSKAPNTPEKRIADMLEAAKIVASKDELQKLRDISLTGSGGGTVTENEWVRFETQQGKLAIGVLPKDLANNAKLTGLSMFEGVHGSPENVIKLLESKKLTQNEYDAYVDEYLLARKNLQIPEFGVDVKGAEWSKLNPQLLQKSKSIQESKPASEAASNLRQRLDAIKQGISSGGTQ